MRRTSIFICLPTAALLLVGCGPQEIEKRTYLEGTLSAPQSAPPRERPAPQTAPAMTGDVPTGQVELAWEAPAGWEDLGGGGMRIASFRVDEAECAITAFPGDVGGLKANLNRWLGQLNARVEPDDLDAFIADAPSVTTASDITGQVYDFSQFIPEAADTPSMIAGVFKKDGSTVFVKLTGTRSVLATQREAFDTLCRSLK